MILLPCMFGPLPAERFRYDSDLEDLEKIGPKVHAVLTRRCCFKWSVTDVVRYMNENGMDPLAPDTDRKMADTILRKDVAARRSGGTNG